MKKILSFMLALALVLGTVIPSCLSNMSSAVAASETTKNDVSILFTHDMHSHMETEETTVDGVTTESGGFAKVKTIVDETEEEYPGTFVLDGGDFAMGTPFQAIFRTVASELKTMAAIGYDATTFGNHEFDYKASGLAEMLNTAAEYASEGNQLPAIVGTNIDWDKTLTDESTKEAGQELKDAFDNYGVEDYTIIEKNGVKMAVFGVLGEEAVSNSPVAGVAFDNYVTQAQKVVDEIKKNGEADIIVALSHSGTDDSDFSNSEDVKLAEQVDGIDVIISGHTHSTFEEPKTVGDTVLVCCGEYTKNVGHLVLEDTGSGWSVKDYQLIKLDDTIENDSEIQKLVDSYKSDINSQLFSDYGFKYDEVLATSDFAFTSIDEFGKVQGEEALGNLISDSYIYAVEQAEGEDGEKVDVAIVPSGTIRGSFGEGDITTADAFNVCSLGMGPDGTVGYPLVSIYLTGKELKAVAEVDATISPMMSVARLYTSGLGYTINDKRLFLNRATDISLVDEEGNTIEKLDNNKLYRVVGGLYSCQMLSLVKDQSHGLLSIEPKDKDGNVITDFDQYVVTDSDGNEVKEWYALASYIDSFDNNEVPEYYNTTHNRKVVDSSLNPIKLLKQPNNIAIMLLCIILIPVVIIAGIIIHFVRRKHQRRGYGKSMFAGSKNKMYKTTMGSRGRKPAIRHRNLNVRGKNKKRRF